MTIFAKIRALALLPVCVLLVACDGGDGSESAAKVSASHAAGALHDPHLAGYGSVASAALANAGVVNTGQVKAVVHSSGASAALPPAEEYRARIVEVIILPEAAGLSEVELATARARAFGLEWSGRHYAQVKDSLHCKSLVRGCSRTYGTSHSHPSREGTISTQTEKGYLDAEEKTPYSVTREFLGTRDGNDHYLLVVSVEQTATGVIPADLVAKVASAGADAVTLPQGDMEAIVEAVAAVLSNTDSLSDTTALADAADISVEARAALIFAGSTLPAGAWVTHHFTDPQDPFTRVKLVNHAGGSFEVTRTRSVTYELVYSGEPFHLKLADRMLFSFGPLPETEAGADGLSCSYCTLSDEMTLGQLRPVATAVVQR